VVLAFGGGPEGTEPLDFPEPLAFGGGLVWVGSGSEFVKLNSGTAFLGFGSEYDIAFLVSGFILGLANPAVLIFPEPVDIGDLVKPDATGGILLLCPAGVPPANACSVASLMASLLARLLSFSSSCCFLSARFIASNSESICAFLGVSSSNFSNEISCGRHGNM